MLTLIPTMHGIIDRRMLVNFRVQPEVVKRMLPAPFRPKLVKGWAMTGICLIRLKDIRPHGFPAAWGLNSENAAHRIAVEWDAGATVREGVFIPRRDTSSRLQTLVGARLFPGVHRLADFAVLERNDEFGLQMRSRDAAVTVQLKAHCATRLPTTSVFDSLAEASDFFARGAVGFSTTRKTDCLDGLELRTVGWKVEPLAVSSVISSLFDDKSCFPTGSIQFDCALLMRGIEHEWRVLPQLHRVHKTHQAITERQT